MYLFISMFNVKFKLNAKRNQRLKDYNFLDVGEAKARNNLFIVTCLLQ